MSQGVKFLLKFLRVTGLNWPFKEFIECMFVFVYLTFDSHIDLIIFRPSVINKFTLVDSHIIIREVWDVQVWLSTGCVSQWLPIIAGVITSSITAKGYPTLFIFQVYLPDNKYCLIPCLIAACQVDITPQIESWISGNWKKRKQ